MRDQEPQQVERVLQELVRRFRLVEERTHLAVAARVRPQRRHEVRVRQEPDVEQQVGVDRDAVLEAEAQDRDDELGARRAAGLDAA